MAIAIFFSDSRRQWSPKACEILARQVHPSVSRPALRLSRFAFLSIFTCPYSFSGSFHSILTDRMPSKSSRVASSVSQVTENVDGIGTRQKSGPVSILARFWWCYYSVLALALREPWCSTRGIGGRLHSTRSSTRRSTMCSTRLSTRCSGCSWRSGILWTAAFYRLPFSIQACVTV